MIKSVWHNRGTRLKISSFYAPNINFFRKKIRNAGRRLDKVETLNENRKFHQLLEFPHGVMELRTEDSGNVGNCTFLERRQAWLVTGTILTHFILVCSELEFLFLPLQLSPNCHSLRLPPIANIQRRKKTSHSESMLSLFKSFQLTFIKREKGGGKGLQKTEYVKERKSTEQLTTTRE